ncbi:MAG TPA: hypothetical protein VJQ25_11220, partial [Nitrospira sp.]|nr:hypothetical protein [Nitrospira sp.]
VNAPGFPIPRMRAAMATEDGPWTTLVAAGIPTEEHIDMVNAPYSPGTLVIKRRASETFIGNGNNQYTKGGRGRGRGASAPSGSGGGGGSGAKSAGGGTGDASANRRGLQGGRQDGKGGHGTQSAQAMIFKKRGDADKKDPDGPLSASKNADDLVKSGRATHGEAIESVAKDRGISVKTRTKGDRIDVGTGDGEADIGHFDKKTDMGTIYTTTVPYEVKGYKNFVNESVHHPWNFDQDADVRPPEKKRK